MAERHAKSLRDREESHITIQLRVLFALMMREMTTRFGRSWGGYLWALLEPAGTVALLTVVMSQVARHPPLGASFPLYFASGYMAFHIYMDVSRNVSQSIKVNRPLLSFPRVTLLDVLIARFTLQALTAVSVFTVVMALLALSLDQSIRVDLGQVLLSIALALMLGLGVGALNSVLFALSQTWERAFNIINRPLFIISGVFFNFEGLPRAAQDLIWWNPLVHVTAIMRRGFYPQYDPVFVSPMFCVFVAAAMLSLGVVLLKLLKARVLEE